MTEDDAKTKWCPMVRGEHGENATSPNDRYGMCIGADCMMWRWHKANSWSSATTADKLEQDKKNGPRMVPQPPDDNYRWTKIRPKDGEGIPGWTQWAMDGKRDQGYCGLAREPDEKTLW